MHFNFMLFLFTYHMYTLCIYTNDWKIKKKKKKKKKKKIYIYIYIYIYIGGLEGDRLMFKLDFKNAFNSIRRDLMLSRTLERVPVAFPLAYISYRQPSFLFHGEYTIESCEGVQQGDPLGPLLFCIAIHDLINTVKSEFSVFYLDDGILGGSSKDVIIRLEST